MLGVENNGVKKESSELQDKIKNYADQVSKTDVEIYEHETPNGFGKKIAVAGILVSLVALGYILFSGNSETHTPNSSIPIRDNQTKVIKDTYEGMETQNENTISDFTKSIIENTETPSNTELSLPKITNEDGKTYTSNGVIRIEETQRTTPNSQDGTLFENSLIEERRDAGMEIDQRLNDAKVNDIFAISKGLPAEFTDTSSQEVAPSSGRVLILGGQVNEPDRVIDKNPVAVEGISPDYNMYSGSTGGYVGDAISGVQNINPKNIGKKVILGTIGSDKAYLNLDGVPYIGSEYFDKIFIQPKGSSNENSDAEEGQSE